MKQLRQKRVKTINNFKDECEWKSQHDEKDELLFVKTNNEECGIHN